MTLSFHTIKSNRGATHRRKRIGRGNASGHGTYATRGQKGQRSRSGGRKGLKLKGVRRLILSIPKTRGFKSLRARPIAVRLAAIDKKFGNGETVDVLTLVKKGVMRKGETAKIVADGELSKKITVRGVPVSANARQKILAAGGIIE